MDNMPSLNAVPNEIGTVAEYENRPNSIENYANLQRDPRLKLQNRNMPPPAAWDLNLPNWFDKQNVLSKPSGKTLSIVFILDF